MITSKERQIAEVLNSPLERERLAAAMWFPIIRTWPPHVKTAEDMANYRVELFRAEQRRLAEEP